MDRSALLKPPSCDLCGDVAEELHAVCGACFGEIAELASDRSQNRKPLPRLIAVDEAARFLDVSARTVRRLINAGELGAVEVGSSRQPHGRRYKLRAREIKRFLANRVSLPESTESRTSVDPKE